MKDQILDEIIVTGFHKHLKRNEKIIWEGNPQRAIDFSLSRNDARVNALLNRIGGLFLFGVLLYFFSKIFQSLTTYFFILIFLIVGIIPNVFRWIKKKKTKYLISDQRILFQLWDWKGTKFYDIPFSEITNFIITYDTDTDGVIRLAVKKPYKIPFETYDLNSGERRHQPTLEMIEDVEEVGKYITLGIQGKL